MAFYTLSALAALCVAFVASQAALPGEIYWDSVLPNTPMPRAISNVLQPGKGDETVPDQGRLDDDRTGYNRHGYNKRHYTLQTERTGYNRRGYNKRHYTLQTERTGYNRRGYNKRHYDSAVVLWQIHPTSVVGEYYAPSKAIYKEAPSFLPKHTNPKLLSSSKLKDTLSPSVIFLE